MEYVKGFSSFSVDDITTAKQFYTGILGLKVTEAEMGNIHIRLTDGTEVLVYPKGKAHQPAGFTILNFVVENLDSVVDELAGKGVQFEHYEGEIATDDMGIFRGADKNKGPNIAWFRDPANNILSLIESTE